MDRLIGEWNITMHHSEFAQPVTGRQRYERVLGGAFILLHWEYDHPDFPNAMAFLDESHFSYFDVRGIVRDFDARFDEDGWSMTFLDDGFSQRSVGVFDGDNSIEANGDRSTDRGATWQHDFTISYARVR